MNKRKTLTVDKVLDGDTFVSEGEKIRIAGVDTPEKGKPGSITEKNYLKRQIEGKNVVFTQVARDKFGRRVGHVYKGGKSIGKKIKKRGW